MKTFVKRAIVVFLLLVMVVNQVGPARALEQPRQPAVSQGSELTDAPLAQRELVGKPPAPRLYDQPPAPKPAKVKVKLSANPKFISGDGQVTLHWQVTDLPEGASPILKISFPEGYTPVNVSGYDAVGRTLSIPVTAESGDLLVDVQGALDTAIFPATLLNGTDVLATDSLSLPKHEQFTAKKNGASLTADKGRIKVSFGKKSLPEDAIVNVGVPAGDSVPAYSLSGHPFEIDAQGAQSGEALSQFDGEVSIDVDYSDFDLNGKNEQDLYLYYYNPATSDWYPLPSSVDPATKTLHATTTHFTVFDTGLHDWEASHLPTLDNFQVSGFTGAATYSMPIEVPPGPGGLQPGLGLSYNSQVIDQSTSQTQASWVGMGWSLDMNFIELNDHGSNESNTQNSWTSDDTWAVNVNGISSTIVKNGTTYRAADENFVKLDFDSGTSTWTVWDKQGNSYYFEEKARQVNDSLMTCGPTYQPYKWMLTRMRNIFGKELTYTYDVTETKTVKVKNWNSAVGVCQKNSRDIDGVVTAIYPKTITYPDGHYRIRFDLEDRSDYRDSWRTDMLYHSFERQRLHAIVVEQDHGGDGTFENIVRKYVFEYASNAEGAWANDGSGATRVPLWSGISWPTGGKTSTLLRVHQFGEGGNDELPTAVFSYGDNMHLTRADNGYGGRVVFSYERWYYDEHSRQSQTYKQEFSKGTGCDTGHFESYQGGIVNCESLGNGVDVLKVSGKAINSTFLGDKITQGNAVRPGGVYKFSFVYDKFGVNTTLTYGFRVNEEPGDIIYKEAGTNLVILPSDASKVDVILKVNGDSGGASYALINQMKVQLLTSVYRVKSRTIEDGNNNTSSEKYEYAYSGGAVNDSGHLDHPCSDEELEATPPTCQQYSEKYSEFRGFSEVTETAPDGRVTITTYHQSDTLKGRPQSIIVKDKTEKLFSAQFITYKVLSLGMNPLYANNLPYADVTRDWVVTQREENRVYRNDGSSYEATRVDYEYESTYGNLLSKTESFKNGSGWTTYRITNLDYAPNVSGGVYLTGLPSRQWVTDAAGNFLAQTFNLYDSNTNWNMPPTVGKLKRVRTWAGGENYSQVFYTYDGWGNRTATTAYSDYASSDADPPAGSAITQTVVFDPIYHTYPVEQRTPPVPGFPDGFVTTFDYDYTLGLPVSQIDANGTLTRVRYDDFGRMVKLIKQGDGDLSPSLEIVYNDSAHPFNIVLHQKVDSTRSYSIRHNYDGLGRETLTETSSDRFATIYSKVSYESFVSEAGQRFAKQSAPYGAGESAAYTTNRYDAFGRPVSVTAPAGNTLTTSSYDGLTSSVTDANGHTTTSVKDIVGRTETITPPDGPAITYNYDTLGQLISVLRGGQTTTISYDKAGRKTEMNDPDMGHWYYKYNALGNLTAQVDAKKQAVNLYYDILNRLKGKTYTTGPVDGVSYNPPADPGVYPVRFSYDNGNNARGRRTRMDDPTGFTTWTYDERGRVICESKNITGFTSPFNTCTNSYNSADMPLTVAYPDGETVTNTYNAQMLVEKVTSNLTDPATNQPQMYVRNIQYDVAGRVTLRVLGNNNQSAYSYYPWNNAQGGRLRLLQSGTDGNNPTSLQDITYTYDAVGNIQGISDTTGNEIQSFGYDALDRLINASSSAIIAGPGQGAGSYNESYSYDPVSGNLKTKAGVTLYYDDVNHAHAIKSTSNGSNYTYDANGNQTQRTVNPVGGTGPQTYNLAYDVEGRLISVQQSGGSQTQPTATATATSTLPPTLTSTRTPTPTATPVSSTTVTLTSIGAEDGSVLESSATSETGGSTDAVTNTFSVGDDASNRQFRSIISFDTDSLPANAIIQTATLRIKKFSQVGSNPLAESNLRVEIAPAPGKFGTGYTLQNMDFDAAAGWDPAATILSGTSPDANGWFSASLNANGRNLINLNNNTQFRLRFGQADNGNGVADIIKFISGDSSGGKPELVITYTLPATATPTKTITSTPTKTATPTATATRTPVPSGNMTTNSAAFSYDGDGKMIKSIIDGVTTVFVSPVYQFRVDPAVDGGQPVITKYYPGGALRTSHPALGTSTLYYTLSDHLGSTSITTNASGVKIAEMRYKAWGEVRYANGDSQTDRTYTGQRSYSSDFGLMFYNARWYDTNTGRFAQADNIDIKVGDTQSLDRFAYVSNNPIIRTDPTGHVAIPVILFWIGVFFLFNSTSDSYRLNMTSQELQSKQASFDIGTSLMLSGLGMKSPTIETAANLYDCLQGVCDLSLMLPGSSASYNHALDNISDDLQWAANKLDNKTHLVDNLANVTKPGITVLGRSPVYLEVANDIGGNAHALNVPREDWGALSEAEQWAHNLQWLNDSIARGDTFYLASKYSEARPGTFYQRELEYLFSLGYTMSPHQNYLIPPIKNP